MIIPRPFRFSALCLACWHLKAQKALPGQVLAALLVAGLDRATMRQNTTSLPLAISGDDYASCVTSVVAWHRLVHSLIQSRSCFQRQNNSLCILGTAARILLVLTIAPSMHINLC